MLLIVSFRVQFVGIGYHKSKNIGFSGPICYACLRAFIQLVKTRRSKGTHGHLRPLWDRVETMVVSRCVTVNPPLRESYVMRSSVASSCVISLRKCASPVPRSIYLAYYRCNNSRLTADCTHLSARCKN